MKIVTGGAGFIGSNIVKQLNNRGINDILIVDDLTDGRKCRNLQGLDFFDYMDYADFDEQMADDTFDCGYIDVVFHEGSRATDEPSSREMMNAASCNTVMSYLPSYIS